MVNKSMMKTHFIVWGLVFATILLVYRKTSYDNPIVRRRLERVEPFKNAEKTSDFEEETAAAEATLNKPREPYSLLKDAIPLSSNRSSPTSQRCYDADFQSRIEKTGNYRQLTNNYKRGYPDSCSSPLHEFVLSFYTPPTI